jgi:hypothetical protein
MRRLRGIDLGLSMPANSVMIVSNDGGVAMNISTMPR